MNEVFLHYIWQHKRYSGVPLRTIEGIELTVDFPGEYNRDAGPDFLHARLIMDGILWVGNVEIHLRTSDWNRHDHSADPNFSNCILHVVWEHDKPILDIGSKIIPTLELSGLTRISVIDQYKDLMQRSDAVACSGQLNTVDELTKHGWLDRMWGEWLQSRTALMRRFLEATRWHWEESFYHAMARAFGFHVNGDPFERLARSVPFSLMVRNRDRPTVLTALFFGNAGFLDADSDSANGERLLSEYRYLSRKWNLSPPPALGWKFMRMRPPNFPTVRLFQFIALYSRRESVMDFISTCDDPNELIAFLRPQPDALPSAAGIDTASISPMGETSVRILLVNTILPFMILKAGNDADELLAERAYGWYYRLAPERNAVSDVWRGIGWRAANAAESQAQLHLYNNYCSAKKCLHCEIGNRVLCYNEMSEASLTGPQ